MRTALVHGCLLGLSLFICLLGLHAIGLHADPSKVRVMQMVESLLSYIFLMAALLACLRRLQNADLDNPLGYAKALGHGALLALTGGLVLGLGHWVYGTFINPGYRDILREALLTGVNLTPEQLAIAEPDIQFITSPTGIAIGQGVPLVAFGLLMSLVVAIFFRRTALNTPARG
ncbi:MAG: DUF4199 domain-containing protein [Verrucomicrobiota bacterium]